MDSGIGESDFEILIAIFAGTMMHCSVGVIGSGDKSAVRDKVFVGGEAFNAVDLQVDGESREFADTGNIEKSLNVIVGNQHRMERFLQSKDLL